MTSAAPSPYREGRLFVYGTLMFPEVVQRLLDRPVSMRVATLRGYQRVAIDRGAGGAKGPIIVPTPATPLTASSWTGCSMRSKRCSTSSRKLQAGTTSRT